jgi:hypothetical protein
MPQLSALSQAQIEDWASYLAANLTGPTLDSHVAKVEKKIASASDSEELNLSVRLIALKLALDKQKKI